MSKFKRDIYGKKQKFSENLWSSTLSNEDAKIN